MQPYIQTVCAQCADYAAPVVFVPAVLSSSKSVLWSSNAANTGVGPYRVLIQDSGNVVLLCNQQDHLADWHSSALNVIRSVAEVVMLLFGIWCTSMKPVCTGGSSLRRRW